MLPPADVVAILKRAEMKHELISSSGDDGHQRIKQFAPKIVITELRRYRSRREIST